MRKCVAVAGLALAVFSERGVFFLSKTMVHGAFDASDQLHVVARNFRPPLMALFCAVAATLAIWWPPRWLGVAAALLAGSIAAAFIGGFYVAPMVLLHFLTPLMLVAALVLLTTTFEPPWSLALAAAAALIHNLSEELAVLALPHASWGLVSVFPLALAVGVAAWWFAPTLPVAPTPSWPSLSGSLAAFGAIAPLSRLLDAMDAPDRYDAVSVVAVVATLSGVLALVVAARARVRWLPVWLGLVALGFNAVVSCAATVESTMLVNPYTEELLVALSIAALWASAASLGPKLVGAVMTAGYFAFFFVGSALNLMPLPHALGFFAVCAVLGAVVVAAQLVVLHRASRGPPLPA